MPDCPNHRPAIGISVTESVVLPPNPRDAPRAFNTNRDCIQRFRDRHFQLRQMQQANEACLY